MRLRKIYEEAYEIVSACDFALRGDVLYAVCSTGRDTPGYEWIATVTGKKGGETAFGAYGSTARGAALAMLSEFAGRKVEG